MAEDKDILMLKALHEAGRTLADFSLGPDILPDIKAQLTPKRWELSDLMSIFEDMLTEETNLITERERLFVIKIQDILEYGIAQDQPLMLAALDRLITYIREKIALIRSAQGTPGVPGAIDDEPG